MKIKVEVEVSKEAYELGQGLAVFIKAAKQALNDGFQPGQDLPALMMSAMNDLLPAVQGLDQIEAEIKEDGQAFRQAVALGLSGISEIFLGATKAPE